MKDELQNAFTILESTSRTFFIPISRLPDNLQVAVASAYLCMRAIDEIEDHPHIKPKSKAAILKQTSLALQTSTGSGSDRTRLFDFLSVYSKSLSLPDVTIRLSEWVNLAPFSIAPRILDATAAMADRMSYWALRRWKIISIDDLDQYTFGVAGAVGLLLSDIWCWYDQTQTNRGLAVGFGRGLQAVNILRNRDEDIHRGVDFFPTGWGYTEMSRYAKTNLKLAEEYTSGLPDGPVADFCKIPLALANATLKALSEGKGKLSRDAVLKLVNGLDIEKSSLANPFEDASQI